MMDQMESRVDTMPDLQAVHALIVNLYNNEPNAESKEMSSKMLTAIQHSIYGWTIADQLLLKKMDSSSCYFAAQTLRTKIANNFKELPEEAYSSLKDSIIKHLVAIDETVVQTQLCLCVTYLAILMPNWTNPIAELAAQVPNPSVLVEILILLAEEMDGQHKTIKVDHKRRDVFMSYLRGISPQIMHMLATALNDAKASWQPNTGHKEESLIVRVYQCLGVWAPIMDKSDISQIEPIVSSMFESIRNADCPELIHDSASNALINVAILCEDYQKYQQLTHYMLNQVYLSEPAYHQTVANEDTGKTENFVRIFTELAESVLDPLFVNEVDLKLLHLMLTCIGHYETEMLEITIHFWYRLSDLMYKKPSNAFVAIYSRLFAVLTKHCQIEPDSQGMLDSKCDCFDIRYKVKDLVRELIPTISFKNYVVGNNIFDTLKTVNSWEVIESNLFMIECILGERHSHEDSQEIIDLIGFMLNFSQVNPNSQHIQVYATICSILGGLSHWFRSNPQFLESVISFLINMITNCHKSEQLSSCSAQSLQSIIESCATQHLMGNANLLSLLIQICCQLDIIKNEEAANNLLQCCAAIVSTVKENQDQLVAQLLTPNLERLQELVHHKTESSRSIVYLDRIASIFRKLRLAESSLQSQLLIPLVTDQLWPLASIALTGHAATNPQLIERCCRCLRFVIRCFRPSWLLQPIVNQIVPLYQQFPNHTSFLYLGSILVDEFANEKEVTNTAGLIQMLNEFAVTTFKMLCDSHIRMHPDTIDDFFRLCTRTLQKCSVSFLANPLLDNILNLTLASIQLDHRDANSSVVKFTLELIDCKANKDLVDKMLSEKFGAGLVDTIIQASLFHLSSYLITDMCEILWSLMMWNRNLTNQWLAHTLKLIPERTTTLMSASPEQLEEFYTNSIKANSCKTIVSSLRYLARLYR